MVVLNGRFIRELWVVQFASKKNTGKGREIHFEEIIAGIKVWAVDGDEAVREAQEFAQKNSLPWLGIRGVTSLDLIESHIYNQPKAPENEAVVQPPSGRLPDLKSVPPANDALNEVMQQDPVPVEQSQSEKRDRPDEEPVASSPASLIVRP